MVMQKHDYVQKDEIMFTFIPASWGLKHPALSGLIDIRLLFQIFSSCHFDSCHLMCLTYTLLMKNHMLKYLNDCESLSHVMQMF